MPNRRSPPKTQRAAPTEPDHRSEPATGVLRRFRLVFNAVKTHFQQVKRKAGVGGAQIWALSVVRGHPGIGVNALAKAMDIHQTTASNLVKSLIKLERLAAEKSGPDRRAVQLRLLRAGKRALRRAPGPVAGVLPEALARLDADTLDRLDQDCASLSGNWASSTRRQATGPEVGLGLLRGSRRHAPPRASCACRQRRALSPNVKGWREAQ